jgi:hypothetical protein
VVVSVLRAVARRRLAKTKNPSACATVVCKWCKSAIVLREAVTESANKSNHPN